jgi:F-type H+-transporting ATPase subunit delta
MHITPEFNKMLSNPRLTLEEKETFLHRTLAGASEELIGFIYLILKNSRERELTDIFSLFLEMARARMGITSVQVFTAVPLTVLQVSVIRAKMATLLNNEIELEAVVDESLIGGLLLKAKGMVVDNTIKKYLQNLKRRIL